MKWVVLSLTLLLSSCSANWHLKKAVRKDPAILKKDTLVVVDTIVQQPVALKDTVILKQHDTIRLVKDRLKVEIVKVNDTITIDAICDSDTIIRVIEVPYEKVVYVEKESFKDKLFSFILALTGGLLGFILITRWMRG